MTYIASNPITQFFQEGTDYITVGATPTTVFTLTRPVATVHSILVYVGNNSLLPNISLYTVSGTTLTLATAISNTTLSVRYLTTSTYALVPGQSTIPVTAISTSNTGSNITFLRGDGYWAGVGIPIAQINTNQTQISTVYNGKMLVLNSGVTNLNISAGASNIGDAFTLYNNTALFISIMPALGVSLAIINGNAPVSQPLSIGVNTLATIVCIDTDTYRVTATGNIL